MAKTVSIIGCGWLGLPLAHHLISQGYHLKGSTTQLDKKSELISLGIDADILELDTLPFSDVPTSLLNADLLIITIPFKRTLKDPTFYTQQIQHLKHAALEAGVQQFILCSSTSIYPLSNAIINEDSPISELNRPQALYCAENCLLEDPQSTATVLRFGGLFGPNREPHRFFSKKPTVTGGNTPVNLIHLNDCIGLIQTVIEHNVPNDVFNAVSPDHPSRREFYKTQSQLSGVPAPTFVEPSDGDYKLISSEKARRVLGYEFSEPL